MWLLGFSKILWIAAKPADVWQGEKKKKYLASYYGTYTRILFDDFSQNIFLWYFLTSNFPKI